MGTQETRKSRRYNQKYISKCPHVLEKHTNLSDSEAVKTFVATYDRHNGYKRNLIMAYEHYARLYNLTFSKPKYQENAKVPKIPQEAKIETIMANSPLELRTAIAISKDNATFMLPNTPVETSKTPPLTVRD